MKGPDNHENLSLLHSKYKQELQQMRNDDRYTIIVLGNKNFNFPQILLQIVPRVAVSPFNLHQ